MGMVKPEDPERADHFSKFAQYIHLHLFVVQTVLADAKWNLSQQVSYISYILIL